MTKVPNRTPIEKNPFPSNKIDGVKEETGGTTKYR